MHSLCDRKTPKAAEQSELHVTCNLLLLLRSLKFFRVGPDWHWLLHEPDQITRLLADWQICSLFRNCKHTLVLSSRSQSWQQQVLLGFCCIISMSYSPSCFHIARLSKAACPLPSSSQISSAPQILTWQLHWPKFSSSQSACITAWLLGPHAGRVLCFCLIWDHPHDLPACSGKTSILLHFAHQLAARGSNVTLIGRRGALEHSQACMPAAVSTDSPGWEQIYIRWASHSSQLWAFSA